MSPRAREAALRAMGTMPDWDERRCKTRPRDGPPPFGQLDEETIQLSTPRSTYTSHCTHAPLALVERATGKGYATRAAPTTRQQCIATGHARWFE
jgi:hypothetical protein